MIYNIKKLKFLRNLNLNNLYGFTYKINAIFKRRHIFKQYKIPLNIKILKTMYDIKEKKLKSYFNKFLFFNMYKFLNILKLRLDFILFNFNLSLTLNQAKQYISHKHILINNKTIKTSSYCVKNNDIVHINNISDSFIKKILTYNYIIKGFNISILNLKTSKLLKLSNNFKDILLKFDTNNLNSVMCNKNFKIKINKNNITSIPVNSVLNNN